MPSIDNIFSQAASNPTQAINLGVANQVSDIARSGGVVSSIGGQITKKLPESNERLFSVKPRYADISSEQKKASITNPLENRGQWAYIKLLTSQKQASEYVSSNTTRDVTYKEELLGSKGEVSKLADSTGTKSSGYDKFLLTGVSCSMTEKVQISEVFGDNEVVYYFGRQPMIFNFSGVLVDSITNDWLTTWFKLYNDFFRGTKTAQNYELIKIVLPNMAITGTISGFSWQQESARDTDVPFTFQFIAKIVEPIAATGNLGTVSSNVASINFTKVAGFNSLSTINSLKKQLENASDVIKNPTASLKDRAAALSNLGSGLGGTFGAGLLNAKGNIDSFQGTIEGWNKSTKSYFNSISNSAMYQTVTSSLAGIRTNLFSPIYGVLSSLTKLVSNTFNTANSIINNLITPVRNLLRDITNISKQAVALVNLVNNSIKGFGRNIKGQLSGLSSDVKIAIKNVGLAAGVIATAPITMANSVVHMFSNGLITTNSAFLQNSAKLSFTKSHLNPGAVLPKNKSALLKSVPIYSANVASRL